MEAAAAGGAKGQISLLDLRVPAPKKLSKSRNCCHPKGVGSPEDDSVAATVAGRLRAGLPKGRPVRED